MADKTTVYPDGSRVCVVNLCDSEKDEERKYSELSKKARSIYEYTCQINKLLENYKIEKSRGFIQFKKNKNYGGFTPTWSEGGGQLYKKDDTFGWVIFKDKNGKHEDTTTEKITKKKFDQETAKILKDRMQTAAVYIKKRDELRKLIPHMEYTKAEKDILLGEDEKAQYEIYEKYKYLERNVEGKYVQDYINTQCETVNGITLPRCIFRVGGF